MPLDFTLLTYEQLSGDKGVQLDVIKKYGAGVAQTDLAILLRGMTDIKKTSEGDPSCYCWTSSFNAAGEVLIENATVSSKCFFRDLCVRPALPPSATADLVPTARKKGINGIEVVEYGEYPQTIADAETTKKLEEAFKAGILKTTGKSYTFDSVDRNNVEHKFQPAFHPEYEYQGKKYICIACETEPYQSRLSNGERPQEGPHWIEVQPIEWLTDPTGTWVSKKALIAGLQVDHRLNFKGNFEDTFMKHYLGTYFAQEMGHEERLKELKKQAGRKQVLTGLSARLEAITNAETIDAIKERLRTAERGRKTPTEPKRMEEAARIKHVRQARDVILKTLREVQATGDEKLIQEIINMDMVRYYDSRYQIQQEKVQQRRTARKQSGRG